MPSPGGKDSNERSNSYQGLRRVSREIPAHQDFNEQRIGQIRSGIHTPEDVVNLLGHPQTKVFTRDDEEWAYRYHVPPSLLRSGMEKILTIRFREGKVQEVRYSVSAL
ncbi:MAG: outer membrane protein assembly factor BamE [candidate division NC10 bacterium]